MEDKLIVAACGHPDLYDVSSYFYRDRNKKDLAWKRISEEIGQSADEMMCLFRGSVQKEMEESEGHIFEREEKGDREKKWISSRVSQKVEVLCGPVLP
ncbi:hypothetical protein DPX16_5236 [Anabarilius grahami]|uniref:MADF domain-containing protein n=1 Tax=Anabarilius grahami TaxID=495550 RepID=A0A3N0Y1C0_ANAGA|nr:hypothetical protein DPX16_5236 [Anabarilius grahami]